MLLPYLLASATPLFTGEIDSPAERRGFELLVPLKGGASFRDHPVATASLVGAKKQHSCREGPVVRIRLPQAVSRVGVGC